MTKQYWSAVWCAGLLVTGVSVRANAVAPKATHLRPATHTDKLGRVFADICPERTPGQRRCFSQRLVTADAKVSVHPDAKSTNSDPNCASQGSQGSSTAPTSGVLTPSDVIAAYNIPASAQANGKIVALVELPSTHALTDVNTYRKAYGIPALAACPTDSNGVPTPNGTACFSRVGEDGTVNSVTTKDCPGWSPETGLDMDMVSAACPDCSIVVVEASSTDDLDKVNVVAASVVKASAVSNSWGAPEQTGDDASYYAATNITTLAASGDSGYLDEAEGNNAPIAPNFPASVPTVLSVGGTNLTISGSGANATYSEAAWNDGEQYGAGGSGCSTEFAMPSYQTASGFSFGSCTQRASVDVSAAAEFTSGSNGGIAAYDADDGWNIVVGTSAASPLVAAILVRTGIAGAPAQSLLYQHISAFNDVTSGSNDNTSPRVCTDVMCTAGVGWDGPTGLGSPNATALIQVAAGGGTPNTTPDMSTATTVDASTGTGTGKDKDGGTAGTGTAGEPDLSTGVVFQAADMSTEVVGSGSTAIPPANSGGCSMTPSNDGKAATIMFALFVLGFAFRRKLVAVKA